MSLQPEQQDAASNRSKPLIHTTQTSARNVRWPYVTLIIAIASPFVLGFVFFLLGANKGWSDGLGYIAAGVGGGLVISFATGIATMIGFLRHFVQKRSSRFLVLAFSVPPLLVIALYFAMFLYAYGVHPINAYKIQPYIHGCGVVAFLILVGLAWRSRAVGKHDSTAQP